MSTFPDLDDTTRELLADAAAASPARRQVIQNHVVVVNLAMAHRLARRYRGRGVSDDDLEQVARLGLLKAVRRFDPDARSFAAYAVPTILGELRRYFRDHAWGVRPGRHLQDVQAAARTARDDLRAGDGHEPSVAEVAELIGETEVSVREADSVVGAYAPQSLDAPTPGGERSFGDSLGMDDAALLHAEDLQAVAPTLRDLDLVDRQLLHMRFVEDRTQADIGRELGISQMQVSRRLAAVLQRIRDRMGLQVPA